LPKTALPRVFFEETEMSFNEGECPFTKELNAQDRHLPSYEGLPRGSLG
jgi:hypothetical protein